jgi:hypothetical protein
VEEYIKTNKKMIKLKTLVSEIYSNPICPRQKGESDEAYKQRCAPLIGPSVLMNLPSLGESENPTPEETLMKLNNMVKGDLERIGDYAHMILDRLNKGEQLSAWMYSQITLSVDQLNSVHDTMDGNDGVIEKN